MDGLTQMKNDVFKKSSAVSPAKSPVEVIHEAHDSSESVDAREQISTSLMKQTDHSFMPTQQSIQQAPIVRMENQQDFVIETPANKEFAIARQNIDEKT